MFGGGASMAIASIWTSIGNWSTPTVLFCVLNIMIATIFIASNFKSTNDHHHSPSQLTRSPSLLERVKSVNLSSFYTSHDQYRVDDYESTTTGYNSVSQLNRAPSSLLQRVKSIDLSFSYFHKPVPTESEQLDNSTSQLTRAPSLLDRVKSFKITSSFNSDPHFNDTNTSQDHEHSNIDPHHDLVEDDHNYVTSNKSNYNELANVSSSEKRGVTTVRRLPSNTLKSRSEKEMVESKEGVPRQATKRESVLVHDQSVDAKADDFIKRFKHQLRLQRIDSFTEMLNRGT